MSDLDELTRSALAMPLRDRSALAERLLASLDGLSAEEADALWLEVAQRRDEDFTAGRTEGIPASEVHARLRAVLP